MTFTRCFAMSTLLLLAVWLFPLRAQTENREAPNQRGPYAEVMSALRKSDARKAIALLDNIPEDHPEFVRAMSDAGQVFAENGYAARGLRFVERAYHKAPNDMEVTHAFIRCQLLARTNLSEPLIARKLPKKTPPEFRFLADAPKFPDESKKLSREKLLADLDFLEIAIANVYSYADRRGADWRGGLDALRASLGDETPVDTFALRLQRFFTLFGDPHTALRAPSARAFVPRGATPFLPVPDGKRVLALKPDRSAFLDQECLHIAEMDGVKISEWLRVAGFDVPKASPQWEWHQTVAALSRLNYLRTELGLKQAKEVRLTLVSADGKKKKKLTMPVAEKRSAAPDGPSGKTRELESRIGYLRIESMAPDGAFLRQLNESMARFRETRGLIIDVRGNGGGSQDAVRTLLPYFLKPGAPMKIINVAAYRLPVKLPQQCTEGYLGLHGRSLHPVTSKVWSIDERKQITAFLQRFTPSWRLPENREKFSDWHVMGIRAETNPNAYHYTNAIVVLSDAGCFSATDNFLGALKGEPNVTLLGTTSGGGSGRMTGFTLPNTKLPFSICQMASFRANGDLFDGHGVAPDVLVEPRPEDFLHGRGDSLLEAAVSRLKERP